MTKNSSINQFRVVEADVDMMREHYARTLKPVKLQPLGAKCISVADQHFSTDEFDIWSGICRSGMAVDFTEPPDAYALYVPLGGTMEMEVAGQPLVSTPEVLVAADLALCQNLRIHENRSHIGLAFSRKAMTRQLSELIDAPVLHDLDLAATLEMRAGPSVLLSSLSQVLWNTVSSGEGQAIDTHSTQYLFRTIMVTILENIPHRYTSLLERPASPAMPRQVKRAIDFMTANVAAPLTVAEIAAAAGVSVRSLQMGFQQFRNTTPLSYLRQIRLEGVRRDLLAAHERNTVADVARRWGFSHMGRFSMLYREAFGELPTESLRVTKSGR
ncbi:AraC family transcriptional regulator [Rhizobium sp. TRM95111]|uniref:helix-turn-helix domain-containing protein n=1 Tax=Rhizobium alarense TaxID=2846851 RepID=UPI001F44BEE2|nr:helix-turn-helix domain-containing protein [Rhizobium alarense]MCF3642784.1 AraC family transcriptional regulator [Rhizobium alarense]